MIYLKRVYERYEPSEGIRILVDRLWPRGIRKSTPKVDLWMKEIGPSDELRKWFSHSEPKWLKFKQRYERELADSKYLEKLVLIVLENDPVTFVYASKDTKHNNGIVLKKVVERKLANLRRRKPSVGDIE